MGTGDVRVAGLVVDQHPRTTVLQPALEERHHRLVLVGVPRDHSDDQVGDGQQGLAGQPVVLEDAVEVGRVDEHETARQARLLRVEQGRRIDRPIERCPAPGRPERLEPKSGQRRLGAQLREQFGVEHPHQPASRPTGRQGRAQQPAGERVEQRRLTGVVRSDDPGDQVSVTTRGARQEVPLQDVEGRRGGRQPVAQRQNRVPGRPQQFGSLHRSRHRRAGNHSPASCTTHPVTGRKNERVRAPIRSRRRSLASPGRRDDAHRCNIRRPRSAHHKDVHDNFVGKAHDFASIIFHSW